MSVEVLREAAALMRERAKAATPGPWRFDDLYQAIDGQPDEHLETRVVSEDGTAQWNGEHIASWPPAVALAVARILDVWVDHDLLDSSGSLADEKAAMVDLARAYLGEQP